MILESLGVPENLLELSEQVYFDIIREIPKYRNTESMYRNPIIIRGNFTISDYNFSEIRINFKFYDYDSLELVGMSYQLDDVTVKNIKFLVQESDFDKVSLGMSFAINDDVTPSMISQYIISMKEKIISIISHELKHAYDAFKNPKTSLTNRINYVTYKKSFGDITPLNELLFNLYFTHQIENLVRPSEFASLVKQHNITKEKFLDFLTNSDVFRKLDSARKFNYENLKEELKKYLPEIEETISMSGSDINKFKTEDQLIDEILRLFYINVANWKFEMIQKYITSSPFEIFLGLSREKENFIEKYYNTLSKYQDNIEKFYRIHENHLKKVSNDMIKKLGKIYDYIKDEKDLKNESIINPDIWYKLKENKGKITNRFI